MQIGVFTAGDLTIKEIVDLAVHAEARGLDVFALGEHHNPPYTTSSPAVVLAHIAARTTRVQLSTATTLITTNDPVRVAEEYATLQHLAPGRIDLVLGRGNTAKVFPWFGRDIADGLPLTVENYHLLTRLWDEEEVTWEGEHRTPLHRFTSVPRPLTRPYLWHACVRSPEIADFAAERGDGLFGHPEQAEMIERYRARATHPRVGVLARTVESGRALNPDRLLIAASSTQDVDELVRKCG